MRRTLVSAVLLPVAACAAPTPPAPHLASTERAPAVRVVQEEVPGGADAPVSTLPPPQIGLGVGIKVRDGDTALALHGSYEVWTSRNLRVGGLGQYSASPFDTLLVAPAAWYTPDGRITLLGAPGLEWENGDGIQPALRLGVTYDGTLGGAAITPIFYWDVVNGRQPSYAFGVSIGSGQL